MDAPWLPRHPSWFEQRYKLARPPPHVPIRRCLALSARGISQEKNWDTTIPNNMEIWWDLMDMNWICKPKKLWSLGVSTVHLLPENCNLDRESMGHDFPLFFFWEGGYCCFFSDCSDVSVYLYKYAQNIMGAYTILYHHQLLVPSRWIETPIFRKVEVP